MNTLRVYAFGRLRVAYAGGEAHRFPTRQAESLFGYLAMHAGADHSRDVRIEQVLGGYGDLKSARARLSTSLWRVRRTLVEAGAPADDFLITERDTVGLTGGATLWVDVSAFLDALQAAATADEPEQAWGEAVAFYQGELCEGLYHDWCLAERERLERLLLRTLGQMMSARAARGTLDEAIALGHRILERDPLREQVHRALMGYYYRAGNRAAAVRQYQRCCELLRAELDIAPMPETQALYLQITADKGVTPEASGPPLQEVLSHLRETVGGMERVAGQLSAAVALLEHLALSDGQNLGDRPKV